MPVRKHERSSNSKGDRGFMLAGLETPPRFKEYVDSDFDVVSAGRRPRVFTGHTDKDGRPITVACGTCHATRNPNFENAHSDDLDEFHRGLRFVHGNQRCLACHDPSNYDQLRLADGSGVPFEDVMQLCAQCHAIQARDFANGAHGGMNGYWDVSRGNRIRHNCTDCHDPHSPLLPRMMPTFKPRDRFLSPGENQNGGDHDEP